MTLRIKGWGNPDHMRSALGVAVLHVLLGYALVTGLGFEAAIAVDDRLKVFNVAAEPPPPPPEAPPAKARTRAPEGAASPPNLKAQASPIVAPMPEIRLETPPPVTAAPLPGIGSEASAGASEVVGPGAGSGGAGTGTGSGGQGAGSGGGLASRAKWASGRIVNADYPRSAWKAKIGGSVTVRFTVGADGSVSGCRVTRTSGNAEIDATTCRLIEQRFRYEPAKDAQGRPVRDVTGWRQNWWLE